MLGGTGAAFGPSNTMSIHGTLRDRDTSDDPHLIQPRQISLPSQRSECLVRLMAAVASWLKRMVDTASSSGARISLVADTHKTSGTLDGELLGYRLRALRHPSSSLGELSSPSHDLSQPDYIGPAPLQVAAMHSNAVASEPFGNIVHRNMRRGRMVAPVAVTA